MSEAINDQLVTSQPVSDDSNNQPHDNQPTSHDSSIQPTSDDSNTSVINQPIDGPVVNQLIEGDAIELTANGNDDSEQPKTCCVRIPKDIELIDGSTKLCLNIYWAEGKRKGNGILVFQDEETAEKVLAGYVAFKSGKNLAPIIPETIKTLEKQWILRKPRKLKHNAKIKCPVALLSVSRIPESVNELEIRDAIRNWGTVASIIFFRDPVDQQFDDTIIHEKFVSPVREDWSRQGGLPEMRTIDIPLLSSLQRGIFCVLTPFGRPLNHTDISMGLKHLELVGNSTETPLLAELEYTKIVTLPRDVSDFFEPYLSAVIKQALNNSVYITKFSVFPPKADTQQQNTIYYQIRVIYDSLIARLNRSLEEARRVAVDSFCLVPEIYPGSLVSDHQLKILRERQCDLGCFRSAFVSKENGTIKIYSLDYYLKREAVKELDQLFHLEHLSIT